MNIDDPCIVLILNIFALSFMAFVIREWLRDHKQKNRWRE